MPDQPTYRPKCTQCTHYFITFDALYPYGCRAMNFKSKGQPQNEVQDATGAGCLSFAERVPVAKLARRDG
jgi:hypothetical protein